MSRPVLALALVLGAVGRARGQSVFVAPNNSTVFATAEGGFGQEPMHQLYVTNKSTVPVIVFSVTLTACENIKQSCGGHPTNIAVPPGQRRNVGKVQAKDEQKGFEYRWAFSYRADSSDAKVLAAMRAFAASSSSGTATADAETSTVVPTVMPAPEAAPSPEGRTIRSPTLEAALRRQEEERARAPQSLRFKVGYGSILGSTMMPNTPVHKTGACVDPTRDASYAHDAKIEKSPWRPAVVPRGIGGPSISVVRAQGSDRDSTTLATELLVRFVADTAGTVIPESVSVLDSPDGALSVKACKSLMGTHVQAAKNKDGHPILSWVQMPLPVSPF